MDSAGKAHKRFKCQCECGTILEKDAYKLVSGAKMCRSCYLKIARFNSIPFNHKSNNYKFNKDYGILFTSNKGTPYLFDLEDYDKIKDYCWYEDDHGYVKGYDAQTQKRIVFHRLVMNAKDGDVVDHINRDTKDCRKQNLRICSPAQNAINKSLRKDNKSGKAGVFFDIKTNKWIARLSINHKDKYLGSFSSKEKAIEARLKAEEQFFGDFAPK